MKRRAAVALVVVAGAYFLLLAAAARPALRPALWGTHAWTFLPLPAVLVALVAAILWGWLLFRSPALPRKPVGFLVLFLGAGVLLYLLRDRTHLLGDGRLWISVVEGRATWHPHEPLAFLGAEIAARFGRGPSLVGRLEIWNCLLGAAGVLLAALLARRLGTTQQSRWLHFAMVLSTGFLPLAAGYIEAYAALMVALLLFLLAGVDVLESGVRPWLAGLFFGVAAGVHGLGLLLLPALGVVTVAGAKRSLRPAFPAVIVTLVAAAVPLSLAYVVLPRLTPDASASEPLSGGWRSLFEGLSFHSADVSTWIRDQVNRGLLAFGASLFLVLAWFLAGGPRAGSAPETSPNTRLFLTVSALALVAPSLVLDMEGSRGAAADWDAVAVAAIPLGLWAASLWRDAMERRTLRLALAVIVALAFFGELAFVLVNASPRAAETRFETLAAASFRTARSRSWAYETLALYRREQGDMNRAASDYKLAVRWQPENERLLRNAAGTLSRAGRAGEAAEVLEQLSRLVPDDFGVWLRLGMERDLAGSPDSAVIAYRHAIRIDPKSIDATNELGRLLLRNPATRPEALDLIRHSLEMKPDQQHAAELREVLRRFVGE